MDHILVTGAAGYIGSVLVRRLLDAGYKVTGLDVLRFGGESLLGVVGNDRFTLEIGDVRDDEALTHCLKGIDAVIHLAAIVGDPACAREPELSEQINWEATRQLIDLCASSGIVKRFCFASTCSNYGKMEGDSYVDESSPLRPVSLYARQKVRVEEYLLGECNTNGMIPISLRFATAYGLSPRPRFDLTVNEFTRDVVKGKTLEIFGEQFWRPYCHIQDLSKACQMVLEADPVLVSGEVFGVGSTAENYQKSMLADLLRKLKPDAEVRFVHRDEDPRDYRVDFTKIKERLGFEVDRTVPDGIAEIASAIRSGLISDPYAAKYRNI